MCRGPVVSEDALLEALRSGHLGGAALDVFEIEPVAGPSPFRNFDNVVLTPHNAPGTRDVMIGKFRDVFDNADRFFVGNHDRQGGAMTLSFDEYRSRDGLGLAKLIADKEVKPEEVLEAALQGAEEVNPQINAIVHDQSAIARGRVAADLPTGPFAGVPFLIKDLYAFQEGQPSGNGSRLWDGAVAPADMTAVLRFREAGLVPFGRTSTAEMGLVWTTEPIATGPTRNPWNLEHGVGGSSGGSAAAVAAGITPIAHATDGGGSIRMPAAQCGLFGLKPSRGRMPIGPIVGEGWAGIATGHVVTRTVRDSAAALDAIGYPEVGDPYTAPTPQRPYLEEVNRAPDRLRVAMHTTDYKGEPLGPEVRAAVEQTGRLLEELGHSVEEAVPPVDQDLLARAMFAVVAANTRAAVLMRYQELERDPNGYGLERGTWDVVERGAGISALDYAEAVTVFHMAGRELGRFFESYDVILSGTMRNPPPKIGTVTLNEWDTDDLWAGATRDMPITPLYNQTGCPAMSVPLAWSADGLPIGIHFGAAYGREDTLVRLAGQLESSKPWFDKVAPL